MTGRSWEALALRFATRRLPAAEFYLNAGLLGVPDHQVTLDYFCWVLRSAGETILVDSGYSAQAAASRSRPWQCAPTDLLRHVGVPPESVDMVVVTHAHWDHTGNLAAYRNAQVITAGSEFNFLTSRLAQHDLFRPWIESDDRAVLIDLHASGRLRLVDDRTGIAPGVDMLVVGGHTPGQAVVTVDTGSLRLILTSDAVHTYDEIETDRPFALCSSVIDMLSAYDTIRTLAAETDALVVPGHDPLVATEFVQTAELTGGVAVDLTRPCGPTVRARGITTRT